jgi:hypothetical protein
MRRLEEIRKMIVGQKHREVLVRNMVDALERCYIPESITTIKQ